MKYPKNQPPLWFLKKNGVNTNKSLLKSEENSFVLLSEEEKLENTRKKLEEDLKKTIMDYESSNKTLKTQRNYLEKRQNELIEELENTLKSQTNEENKGLPFEKTTLIQENERVVEFLKKLGVFFKENANFQAFYSYFTGLINEKSTIIDKIYKEEENLAENIERKAMINEEFMSYQVQIVELAFEYEELEGLLENYQSLHPNEFTEIVTDVDFEEKHLNFTDSITKKKKIIDSLSKKKEDYERNIEFLKEKIEIFNKKLMELRVLKQGFKKQEARLELLRKKVGESLDETGKSALSQYLKVFEDRNINEKALLFQIQDLILEEFLELSSENQSKTSEISQRKTELIEKSRHFSNLKPFLTHLLMNEQIYLNLLSGFQETPNNSDILAQIKNLLQDTKSLSQGFYENLRDLHRVSSEYEKASTIYLEKTGLLSQINKDLSNEMKILANLKFQLKGLITQKRETMSFNDKLLMKGTEDMINEFMKDKNDNMKDLKFKYGKEYVKKVQKDMQNEFLEKNKGEIYKLKARIRKALWRKEEIKRIRLGVLKKLEEGLKPEIIRLNEEKDEIKARIMSLKMKLKEVIQKEKALFLENKEIFEKSEDLRPVLREVLNGNKRSCEILASSSEIQSKEISFLMKRKLFEEKTQGLERNLNDLKSLELKELEENERKLLRQREVIEEKRERLRILREYMKKKGLKIGEMPEKKEKFQRRHGNSKSFVGGFPAKFGLVTIDLKGEARNKKP